MTAQSTGAARRRDARPNKISARRRSENHRFLSGRDRSLPAVRPRSVPYNIDNNNNNMITIVLTLHVVRRR